MKNCVFCKIRDGEMKKEFTYQDDDVMVFPDINPAKPVHLLIVSKDHVEDLMDLENSALWSKILEVSKKLVKENGLSNKGFRLTINGGGSQIIDHLHVHITGPVDKDLKI